MKVYESNNIRNVVLMGHSRSGKTSIVDACMFNSGANTRIGQVDNGTSVTDFEAEEVKRKLSISAALAACEWQDCKINFIDTPGYADFTGEARGAIAGADCAMIVISAKTGIAQGTVDAWKIAEKAGLPRVFFVNKMDREQADFQSIVLELQTRYGNGVVPIQLPVGEKNTFEGIVDLLGLSTRIKERNANNCREVDNIPEYMEEAVEEARLKLMEVVAEIDNTLLEKYLEGEEIKKEEIADALIEGVGKGKIFPVMCGSAGKNVGMHKLLFDIIEYFPAPTDTMIAGTDPETEDLIERQLDDPFSAQVIKTLVDPFVGRLSYLRIFSGSLKSNSTVENVRENFTERIGNIFTMQGKQQIPVEKAYAGDIVVTAKLQKTKTGDTLADKSALIAYDAIEYPEPMLAMAASATKKEDQDKILTALYKQQDEDPSLMIYKNTETNETIVRGVGETHLDVLCEKIQRKFGVAVKLTPPAIPYRETIRKAVDAEAKHKKQSGGHGQYGHVLIKVSPQSSGAGNAFSESLFGGSIPRQFVPAVEKGVNEALCKGVLAGYPVVDVAVNLYDGSYHAVDSSEASFKTAAAMAIKKALADASPVLLEPIYDVTVTAPEYMLGDVVGKLNSKRGQIMGMDAISTNVPDKDMSAVHARVPLGEMTNFATELRSLTQGRGSYTMAFANYEVAPPRTAQSVIEARQKKDEKK